jgi:hypothetical protein
VSVGLQDLPGLLGLGGDGSDVPEGLCVLDYFHNARLRLRRWCIGLDWVYCVHENMKKWTSS